MRCFVLATFLLASFCEGGQLGGDLLLDCSRFLDLVGCTQEMDWHFVLQRGAALQAGAVPARQLRPLQVLQPSHRAHPHRGFGASCRGFHPFSIEADGMADHLALEEEKGILSHMGISPA